MLRNLVDVLEMDKFIDFLFGLLIETDVAVVKFVKSL
jgi:hypothetical protein